MRTSEQEDGYSFTSTPSRVTIRHQLSNGQWLTLWFKRHRVIDFQGVQYLWNVACYIGDRKSANRWIRGKRKKHSTITGRVGAEGLRKALKYIEGFTGVFLTQRDEMQILGEDAKRHRAFKWLLRYPGYTEYTYDDQEPVIAYRDPECWLYDPNDNKKGAGAK